MGSTEPEPEPEPEPKPNRYNFTANNFERSYRPEQELTPFGDIAEPSSPTAPPLFAHLERRQ